MAEYKSVKVQVTFPAGLHARLVAHAERSGLPVTQALLSLVDRSVAINCGVETRTSKKEDSPKDLERQEKRILQQLTPYNDKVREGTITFSESDEWYELRKQLAEVKQQLGAATRSPDEVLRTAYQLELDRLVQHHEAEAENIFNPQSTPEFFKQYEERAQRINTLKDRLK